MPDWFASVEPCSLRSGWEQHYSPVGQGTLDAAAMEVERARNNTTYGGCVAEMTG